MDKMYQSKLLLYTENRSLQIVAMVTCSPGLPPRLVAMVTYKPSSKTHMMVAMVTPIKNMALGVSEKLVVVAMVIVAMTLPIKNMTPPPANQNRLLLRSLK